MRKLSAKELATESEGRVLVDIRRPEEWQATGVIAGCHRLTFNNADIDGWLADLEQIAAPEDELVLICRTGHRTGIVLDFLLTQTAYRRARHLEGGILDWIGQGLPVVAPEK